MCVLYLALCIVVPVGALTDGVIGPLDWSVRVFQKLQLADCIFISGLQVCNRLDMYWSWGHRDVVALVEMEEELSLGFKSNFHVCGSPEKSALSCEKSHSHGLPSF